MVYQIWLDKNSLWSQPQIGKFFVRVCLSIELTNYSRSRFQTLIISPKKKSEVSTTTFLFNRNSLNKMSSGFLDISIDSHFFFLRKIETLPHRDTDKFIALRMKVKPWNAENRWNQIDITVMIPFLSDKSTSYHHDDSI